MAEIVMAVGTSHSPLLAIAPETWPDRAKDDLRKTELFLADGRVVSYDELNVEVGGRHADEATTEHFVEQAALAQAALDRLAAAIDEAELDALIVIGDDQQELFSDAHTPAIAVYNGDEIVTHPKNEVNPNLPAWYQEANRGYKMDTVHRYPGAPELANALIDGFIENGVDTAVASEVADPYTLGFGHAYGFVIDRLVGERQIPILPIMLNTYFPPNVPRPARCYDIGEIIARTIEALPTGQRVGVVASGGLTHFAVDEELDRKVLDALVAKDVDTLKALPHLGLRSGNSEILNWIMTAGAAKDLQADGYEYIPVRRTEAGTGIGMAFLIWQGANSVAPARVTEGAASV
ncbi:hypothetical protein [Georgenia sp. AZ-5]|uniref:DODA-type extradiol aromatic ring-opening family dioxygenase n=1 Tax=Georgenia sp. AZ-5 TaxID=3367526 RepID=UPI003754E79B